MSLLAELSQRLKLAAAASRARERAQELPSHGRPMPRGDTNENPRDIGLLRLIAEDFRTHDRSVFEPGFWAVAVHRFGNARMDVKPKLLRVPLSIAYTALFNGVRSRWSIDLSYTVKLGRRVRLRRGGVQMLGARAIGDDVRIHHNVTLGVADRNALSEKPIIGSGVTIGPGACVLGAVTVGDQCAIGANSVVVRDLPAGCSALGVPARPVIPKIAEEVAAAVGHPPHPRGSVS